MKTIKCYTCECGEDFYEDDTECANCAKPVDQSRFKQEQIPHITEVGPTAKEEIPLLPKKP